MDCDDGWFSAVTVTMKIETCQRLVGLGIFWGTSSSKADHFKKQRCDRGMAKKGKTIFLAVSSLAYTLQYSTVQYSSSN
jgi:hypothetical protein